jgi:hypothetical protein
MNIKTLKLKLSRLSSGKGDKAQNTRNAAFSIADFGVNAVMIMGDLNASIQ